VNLGEHPDERYIRDSVAHIVGPAANASVITGKPALRDELPLSLRVLVEENALEVFTMLG
jgi:hypothetical protein